MAKAYVPQVVTANLLLCGRSVFLGADGWTSRIGEARIATDAAQAQEMLARAQAQPGIVVGPYLVDVVIDDDGRPDPVEMRERMRVSGPSIDLPPERNRAQVASASRPKRAQGPVARNHHLSAGAQPFLAYTDPWMGF